MKKTILLAVSIWTAPGLFAANLLDFVPGNADLILVVRMADSLDLPLVKELRQSDKEFDRKYAALEKELSQNGFSLKDLPAQAVFFGRQDRSFWGLVINTSVTENRFTGLLADKLKSGGGLESSVEKINDQTVYCLKPVQSQTGDWFAAPGLFGQTEMKKAGVFYLQPNIAVITDYQLTGTVLAAIKQGNCRRFIDGSGVNQQTLAWIVYQPRMPDAANPGLAAGAQMFNFMGMTLDCDGPERKDLALNLVIDCKNQNSAAMMAMEAQGAAMLGLSSMFKDNPELAAEIGDALKVQADGNRIRASLQLPERVHKQVKDYLIAHSADSQAGENEFDAPPASKPEPLNKTMLPAAKPNTPTANGIKTGGQQ